MPIIDFTPQQTVSPYAEMVNKELDDLLKAGDGKATEIIVPTSDAGKFKLVFSRAANERDKTARYRIQDADKDKSGNVREDGNTRFVITLSPKHAQRRGKNSAKDAAKDEAKETAK
jgi:hypothetical protein